MSRELIVLQPDMSRQERIKIGFPERLDWPGGRLQLSWEVLGTMRPLKARWLVTVETHAGSLNSQIAYENFDAAVMAFEAHKREHAVAIAMAALKIRKR